MVIAEASRVWVGCLAAYNAGYLHGEWIDAGDDLGRMQEAVNSILKSSPVAGAEEWMIFDHEGFYGYSLGEFSGLEETQKVAAFIAEHGKLGAELLSYFPGGADLLSEAEDAIEGKYSGCYESLADWQQEFSEECGDIPKHLAFYIDWELMARDAELGGDVFTIETGYREVHVFWSH